ncbi:methyltransferase [Leucobacter komagatae]|uniref:methyltransferase n=1 Tax=Leucobacter komagatae TaxID=55969 RepID=UPI001E612637|nr:class I SAM-dependent methyltransferase [Leucobacter komagatae]
MRQSWRPPPRALAADAGLNAAKRDGSAIAHAPSQEAAVTWTEDGRAVTAAWLSANDRPAPKAVTVVDDRLTADQAVRYAAQGTAMLWRGDFHNAKQLLSAIDRRLAKGSKKKPATRVGETPAEEFYRIRQARAQRSRMLSLVLVPLELSSGPGSAVLPLPRAPRVGDAVEFAFGQLAEGAGALAAVSLQELTGVLSAHQWFLNGVDVPSLGAKIHPHYGTFLPTRHEYVDLVAQAPLPSLDLAFDIGVGTGVLSAVLANRGVQRVIGTDIHQRAVDCASDNYARLGIADVATAQLGSMFPAGRAPLIVCNPPWLPGSAASTLDAAVYDPGSKMLLQFLQGLPDHLTDDGEGWLVLSDLAELLGLRTRDMLLDAIAQAGLAVVDRLDTVPTHRRAGDTEDLLHAARSREVTSLWRLRVDT